MSDPRVTATLAYLRRCQAARAAGVHVAYTTDPAWLVDVAINRRAGWPDDPGHVFASAKPTDDGRYPPKASGDAYRHLVLRAYEINTPRRIIRPAELGEHRWLLTKLPGRFEEA